MLNITAIRALNHDDDYEITVSDKEVSNSFTLQANDPQGCVVSWDKALDSFSRKQQNAIFEALWAFHLARHPEDNFAGSTQSSTDDIRARALAYQNIIDRASSSNAIPESFTVVQGHLAKMQDDTKS